MLVVLYNKYCTSISEYIKLLLFLCYFVHFVLVLFFSLTSQSNLLYRAHRPVRLYYLGDIVSSNSIL